MTSDQIVETLSQWGIIRIHQYKGDQQFSATLQITLNGVVSEVKSHSKHPTMLSALTELSNKVRKLMDSLIPIPKEII